MPIKKYFSFVKFAHTIFALPFALAGLMLGFRDAGEFSWQKLVAVLCCMVFARNAAMGFNRYLDREIDAGNPRTAKREIPAGVIPARHALAFVVINALLFMAAAFFINPLCFYLSPVALLVVLGYSYTKRFTALCHLVLGLGLALAPVGAYIAVTEHFAPEIILLGAAVLTWVAGFDIIYALQDDDFDRERGLNSIPALLGRRRALRVSEAFHVVTAGALAGFGALSGADWLFWIGAAAFAFSLLYQHRLVAPDDLSKVNMAFFTTNGFASLILGGLAVADFALDAFWT